MRFNFAITAYLCESQCQIAIVGDELGTPRRWRQTLFERITELNLFIHTHQSTGVPPPFRTVIAHTHIQKSLHTRSPLHVHPGPVEARVRLFTSEIQRPTHTQTHNNAPPKKRTATHFARLVIADAHVLELVCTRSPIHVIPPWIARQWKSDSLSSHAKYNATHSTATHKAPLSLLTPLL
jgi:hypothetical protein